MSSFWGPLQSDRRLPDEEEIKLDELAEYIGLLKETYEEISASVRGEVVQSYYNEIIDDGEISPEEYNELLETAKSLNVKIDFTGEAKNQIEQLKTIWEINYRELQIYEIPIKLQRNEVCYFHNQVTWYEYRAGKSSVPYHGWSGRIRFGKGLYYRYGKINYARETTQELRLIDSGDFFVTNKRVIFTGTKGNKTIPYSSILEIRPYNNGVDIMKASGKCPFIKINKDIEIFTATLVRALNDY